MSDELDITLRLSRDSLSELTAGFSAVAAIRLVDVPAYPDVYRLQGIVPNVDGEQLSFEDWDSALLKHDLISETMAKLT